MSEVQNMNPFQYLLSFISANTVQTPVLYGMLTKLEKWKNGMGGMDTDGGSRTVHEIGTYQIKIMAADIFTNL